MKDPIGDIMFEKVAKRLFQKFNEGDYFEYLASWMRNYMLHLIRTTTTNPGTTIQARISAILGDHVARMFGVQDACTYPHPRKPQ